MKRCSLILGCLIGTAILAVPALSQAQVNDRVYGAGGAPTSGTIIAMSPTSVKVDTNAGEREVATNEIRKIEYAGELGELRTARSKAARGQLEDALADLNKIAGAAVEREVVKQDVMFYRAFCMGKLALAGRGDKASASTAMMDFARAAPGNYHFFDAAELLGDLALAQNQFDQAVTFYSAIGTRAPWPEYKMKSSVLAAQTEIVRKNYQAAMTKYDEVIAMNLATPEANRQKLFALVGKAACLAETGKPQEGVGILNKIIAENDHKSEPVLFARAYNALGACYRKLDKPKRALEAYLHVDVLFRRDAEAHAEALFYLAQLWTSVNKSDRAVEARTLLKDAYSGSRWAQGG